MNHQFYQYRMNFSLTDNVTDFYDANDYLHDDDMTQYFTCEYRDEEMQAMKNILAHVEWSLTDVNEGHIDVITSAPLSDHQISLVMDEISGQNSDGLGEGFEQQDFANYTEYEEYDCEWIEPTFDDDGEVIEEGHYESPYGWEDDSYYTEEETHMASIEEEGSLMLVNAGYYSEEELFKDYHNIYVKLNDLIYDCEPIEFKKEDNEANYPDYMMDEPELD